MAKQPKNQRETGERKKNMVVKQKKTSERLEKKIIVQKVAEVSKRRPGDISEAEHIRETAIS